MPLKSRQPEHWERPKISSSILDHIGNTPLVRINNLADGLDCEVLAKCEFLNAGGSVKDRVGKRMILDAEKSGRIKPGDTLIEPTSGNTGIGLAITALTRGYRMIITLPEKMSDEKMNMLKALGAEIIRTPTEAAWDSPESHIMVAKKLRDQIPNSHILDQYSNPSNPLAHYEGTAEEILYQCDGKLDMIVCGAGTGGTISGIARKLKERLPHIKVVGVDPVGSILAEPPSLNTPGPAYLVEGIGYDFIPEVLDRSLVDEWIKSDDANSLKMSRRIIREEGLMVGGSSGAAMHACLLAAKQLGRGKRVVVVLPDGTRNYMSKFLSDEWMVDKGFEPRTLLSQGSVPSPVSATPEWWELRTAVDLNLPAPITVSPWMRCCEAAAVMREHSIDQLPVVHESDGVVGVVTLGHLTSKILSAHAAPTDPVSRVMYTTFTQVPLGTPLRDYRKIFEKNAYCLVVAPMAMAMPPVPKKCNLVVRKVVVAVMTHADLLEFVMAPELAIGERDLSQSKYDQQATMPSQQLPRESGQLNCSQLAWSFMKTSPNNSKSPAQQQGLMAPTADYLNCSQLAWAFMKPQPHLGEREWAQSKKSAGGGSFPSPFIQMEDGKAGMPNLDIGKNITPSASERASAATTAAASPCLQTTPGGKPDPKFALPA